MVTFFLLKERVQVPENFMKLGIKHWDVHWCVSNLESSCAFWFFDSLNLTFWKILIRGSLHWAARMCAISRRASGERNYPNCVGHWASPKYPGVMIRASCERFGEGGLCENLYESTWGDAPPNRASQTKHESLKALSRSDICYQLPAWHGPSGGASWFETWNGNGWLMGT